MAELLFKWAGCAPHDIYCSPNSKYAKCLHKNHRWLLWSQGKAEHTVGVGCGLKMCSSAACSSENSSSLFSPDGGFEFEEFLRGLDDPGVVAGQDAGAQEEAHVPVALQLVQAALLPQQAAQLHSWNTTQSLSFPPPNWDWGRDCRN